MSNGLDTDQFCPSCSWSKLFVKVISRQQHLPLVGKELSFMLMTETLLKETTYSINKHHFLSIILHVFARDEAYDVLAVADWGQRLSFYQLSGKQVCYMTPIKKTLLIFTGCDRS